MRKKVRVKPPGPGRRGEAAKTAYGATLCFDVCRVLVTAAFLFPNAIHFAHAAPGEMLGDSLPRKAPQSGADAASRISANQQERDPAQTNVPSSRDIKLRGMDNAPPVMVVSNEDYRIGPNDVIEVEIEKAPELSGTFRVTTSGTILMPYLGRITVQRQTPEELGSLIGDGLRGKYLKNPRVTVTVKQYNSRTFFVQGSVFKPGLYQVEGQLSLLMLITIAGGLTDSHGSTAFIIREIKHLEIEPPDQAKDPGSEEPEKKTVSLPPTSPDSVSEPRAKYELLKANISGLLRGGFDQDLLLKPGDIVNIPSSDVFFVSGEVKAPGSFPLKASTTLNQAISLAQGTTSKAARGRISIFREDAQSGKRQEIRVDLGAVMSGKKEDITIMANDVVIVPNSRLKSVGTTLMNVFGRSIMRY